MSMALQDKVFSLSRRSARLVRNVAFDLRYGGFLGGRKSTSHADMGAAWVVNSDYAVLPQIFDGRINDSDVLVEVGCGKGRVINWWLSRNCKNRIIGIELEEEVAEKTRRRLSRYKNVTILGGDAVDLIPTDGTLFYLFNPFTEPVVQRFKDRMWELFHESGEITILYYAPIYIQPFLDDPKWEVEMKHLDMNAVSGNHHERHHRLAVIRIKSPAK